METDMMDKKQSSEEIFAEDYDDKNKSHKQS